jgi:hypothetical protein
MFVKGYRVHVTVTKHNGCFVEVFGVGNVKNPPLNPQSLQMGQYTATYNTEIQHSLKWNNKHILYG